MVRYFIRLSYIGTKYRGTQITKNFEKETIQGVLEMALLSLRPLQKPRAIFASRTDKGVHALMNTVHVDLLHRIENEFYQPHWVTEQLNLYFKDNNHDIVVMKSCIVPDSFHVRKCAKWRSYVYRLAIPKPELKLDLLVDKRCCAEYLPVSEINRCHILSRDLDVQKMQQVSNIYCGAHDFTTFTKCLSREPWRSPLRVIDECRFYPSSNSASVADPQNSNVTMWEFYVKSKAFLYHQIRKLFGAALSVGLGKISLQDLESMLRNPSPEAFRNCSLPPACGLYLTHIQYDKEDFRMRETQREMPKF